MSTTAPAVSEERFTTQEEVAKLAHPKRPARQRVGVVLSYIGMGLIVLYCLIPFYWMVVSSLRLPSEGLSTELIPSPASVENF
jgi:multiple sugar transport system permease protein